jgi:hypothetical protein
MFEEILKMVKDQLGNNPQVSNLPPDQQNAVHEEVASHVTKELKNQAAATGGAGGLLASLEGAITSNSPVVGAIEGGLASSLASKFGLPPMITGAISGALPGLLKKFVSKANDPNDPSITKESINQSLSGYTTTVSTATPGFVK